MVLNLFKTVFNLQLLLTANRKTVAALELVK